MGTLYVVATPIGNMEDITLRALRILREVDLIAAEDTRKTARLLKRYDIETSMTSYFEHNKLTKLDYILETLSQKDVALVSEAGLPGLSDPGYELIVAALQRGIPVVPIPGPSAVVTALAVSGLPTDQFTYLGFLPRRRGERQRLLRSLRRERRTLVAFEAPHRLLASLADVREILGERSIVIAREITKRHEEIWRGEVSGAVAHFEANPPRGEFTLVIAGAGEEVWDEEQVVAALESLLAEGATGREAVKEVAQLANWPKRDVYRMWLRMKGRYKV